MNQELKQEIVRAKEWMQARGLNVRQLAGLTGYSQASVYWTMRGLTPPTERGPAAPVDPKVWRRFKLLCEAVDRRLRKLPEFDWEIQ